MFIAIEGVDGAGKSSLISAIEDELIKRHPDVRITKHHKGRPPEETRRCLLHEYAISLENEDLFTSTHLADRWHWGERTYAPIKRPHTNKDGYGLLGIAGWRWVDLFMQSRGMAQFMLFQRLEVVKERVAARGDDFVDLSELETIYKAYIQASKVSTLTETIMPGNSGLDALPDFASHIIDVARAVSVRASFLQEFPQYIGAIRPRVLLIGDHRNVTEEFGDETILPFMPVNGNSGEFLLSALPEDLWQHVGMVNANEIEPSELTRLYKALGSPMIAALGRSAERIILKTTLHVDDYATIPHPQYVRRFHNSKQHEYGLQIQSISKREGAGEWALQ
jgi:hypothetical protein